jgi:hypothetical protein
MPKKLFTIIINVSVVKAAKRSRGRKRSRAAATPRSQGNEEYLRRYREMQEWMKDE